VKKGGKKSKKGDNKPTNFDDDEWIKGTPHYTMEKKQRKAAESKQSKQA